MLPTKFCDFFKTSICFFASIGIQVPGITKTSKIKQILVKLQFIIQLICVNCLLGGEVIYVLMALKERHNFLESIMTLSYIGFMLVGESKIMVFYRNEANLREFLENLSQLFPANKEQQKRYKVSKYLEICRRISLLLSLFYMTGVWTYNLFPFVERLVYDKWLKRREVRQELPYFMFVMWQWQDHWSFYVLYGGQMMAAYSAMASQLAGDLLMTAGVIQLVMHFDYLKRKLEEYEPQGSAKENKKKLTRDVEFFKEFVKYHSFLLE